MATVYYKALVSTLATAVLAACIDGGHEDPGEDTSTLAYAAAQRGFFIGTSFVEGRQDPRFAEVATREFNALTVPLYASETHPAPSVYNFSVADEAVAMAEQAGMRMRGHPLIWGRLALPDYVAQETDPVVLEAWLRDHVRTLVTRYRGKLSQYDVVNEPITLFGQPGLGGEPIASNVFSELLGVDYIRIALEEARAADPDAQLFLNDFLVMEPGPKSDAYYRLIEQLVTQGTPLDGVGLQAHIQPPFAKDYRPAVETIKAQIARYQALGLVVELTEVDITQYPDQAVEQAQLYRDLVTACLESSACNAVTVWGISDAYTWIEAVLGYPDGKPLLFDEQFQPKPAYDAVRQVLQGY